MFVERIREILAVRPDSGLIASQIAESLGWESEQIRPKNIGQNGSAASTARAFLGRQPATLFVYADKVQSRSSVRQVSAYAYHQTIHWGLICDQEGITAFNSHWISNGDIFLRFQSFLGMLRTPIIFCRISHRHRFKIVKLTEL